MPTYPPTYRLSHGLRCLHHGQQGGGVVSPKVVAVEDWGYGCCSWMEEVVRNILLAYEPPKIKPLYILR
jgi:hypothetical protein